MAFVTGTIGAPSTEAADRIQWSGLSLDIPAGLVAGGGQAQLDLFQMRTEALGAFVRAHFDLRAKAPGDVGAVYGPHLTDAWEAYNPAIVIRAGGLKMEIPGPGSSAIDSGNRDSDEPYDWRTGLGTAENQPLAAAVGTFVAAYRNLTAEQKAATTLTLTDQDLTIERDVAEGISVADELGRRFAAVRDSGEGISVQDSLTTLKARELSADESVGVADEHSSRHDAVRDAGETASVADALGREWEARRGDDESIGVSDALTSIIATERETGEVVTVSDGLASELEKGSREGVSVSDALSGLHDAQRDVGESVGVSDALTTVRHSEREHGEATIRVGDHLTSSLVRRRGSATFRRQRDVRSLSGFDKVFAIEAMHDDLPEPIRVVNDNAEHVIEGNTYIPCGFLAEPPQSRDGEVRQARLSVENVGAKLMKWVDASDGGRGASMRVMNVIPPETEGEESVIDYEFEMDVGVTEVTNELVSVTLSDEPLVGRPSVSIRHDPQTSPGLFAE